ncbi:MAG: aminotransferase [Flavobacterium sp. BFFFF1]|uniref:pyridoxal phosphate-dependent aminotransferase n=1 Tax=Flavobacterium sp. BFFFF1 TaxID=2015557 RepID=UPI000BD6EF39|nr:aminotransferase class I/II-fold pyridoxal phosphate-dependent enzyme [Flavobacterium sp. BFFFF1]OYU79801.1 MAG: aminotransferase [Flavobacterium sp. BFFFF1]
MIQPAHRLNVVEEYYFSAKLREVRQLIADGKPIINMGIGSPDLPPPPTVSVALHEALQHPNAHQYQSYQGIPELRNAMAAFYKKHFNVRLNPANEALPLMGSKEGIMHLSMAFLNEGDGVLIPDPGYPTYGSVANLVGAKPIFYNLTADYHWQPDFEALERLDLSRVKLMWVNYPNMPTGASADDRLFERLIAFARKHHILIINDNPYSFILNNTQRSLLSVEGADGMALEMNSISKTFNMAGWRVGMVAGNARLIDSVLKVKSNMDSGMFYPIQQGAIAALETDNQWLSELNDIYEKRRALTFKLANTIGCTFNRDSAGLFVWGKLPEWISSAERFVDALLHEKHLFIAPGTIFGKNGEGYIRFSLCVPENEIQKAIERF